MDQVKYLKKSGDKRIYPGLQEAEAETYWFSYFVSGDGDFVIAQAMGNHVDIADRARKLSAGRRIIFATWRNGHAFAKLIKGKVIGYIVEVPRWAAQ